MLKLTLLNKKINPAKRQLQLVRQNPDLLENGVVDNTGTWDPNPRNGNGSGQVRIMNPVELKAVCADRATSHPLTASTFQKRKSTSTAPVAVTPAPPAPVKVEEDPYMGFSLNVLGR